jgi:hypothetical protein
MDPTDAPTATTTAAPAELTDLVLQTLERAPQPLTFFQVQRALPRPYQDRTEEIRQSLHELASQGRIHEFPPYRSKAPRFWTRDVEQHARAVIVEVLTEQAATQRELLLRIRRRLQGVSDGNLRQMLSQMLLDGVLRKLPPRPGGRSNLLSAREPEPREYLRPIFRALAGTLGQVYKRLESEGISRERFQQEAEALWQAMPWDRLTVEPEPRRRAAPPEAPPFEPAAAATEVNVPAAAEAAPPPADNNPPPETPPGP